MTLSLLLYAFCFAIFSGLAASSAEEEPHFLIFKHQEEEDDAAMAVECSVKSPCAGEDEYCKHELGSSSGTCEPCLEHPYLCFDAGLSEFGLSDCTSKCPKYKYDCFPYTGAEVELSGGEVYEPKWSIHGMFTSPHLSVSGPLVDCGTFNDDGKCPGADGGICLMYEPKSYPGNYGDTRRMVEACIHSGGKGIILYMSSHEFQDTEDQQWIGGLWADDDVSFQ